MSEKLGLLGCERGPDDEMRYIKRELLRSGALYVSSIKFGPLSTEIFIGEHLCNSFYK